MNSISLLNWMLLSTVLLGACWLCYRLLLRGERSFAYNRGFLVLGPLVAAGLPLLPLQWPAGWLGGAGPVGGMASVLLPAVVVGAPSPAEPTGIDRPFWALAIYLSGAIFMVVRLGWELGRLWLSTRRLVSEQGAGYSLVRTHGVLPTSSFARTVFWDETLPLSAAEADQVLRHEVAHVQQGHTYDRLLLELLRVALWFNPFVHLCSWALALTHEYLADEAALRDASAHTPAFSPTHSYTHLLARQVATRLGFSVPLAHSFSHSQTLRRIAMIQKNHPIRRWKQWFALPLVALSLFTVACEQATKAVAPTVSPDAAVDYSTLPPPPPPAPDMAPPPPPIPLEGNYGPGPDGAYVYVKNMPHLASGGHVAGVIAAIRKKIVYPTVAPANQLSGQVIVSFVVDQAGQVQRVKILEGLAQEYDAAVVAAVKQLPRFVPGTREDGKAVDVTFTVPVAFADGVPVAGRLKQLAGSAPNQ